MSGIGEIKHDQVAASQIAVGDKPVNLLGGIDLIHHLDPIVEERHSAARGEATRPTGAEIRGVLVVAEAAKRR